MGAKDTYRSIAGPCEGLCKDKGSRFIARAWPVGDEAEVREIVSAMRKEYHDARHHCHACRIGPDGGVWRASDDGEPAGSAGRPILGRIDAAGLSDVLVVVIRYFGGIKLGVPGLINAYKSATEDALAHAQIIEKTAGRWYTLHFPYDSLPAVMRVAKDLSLPRRGQAFLAECSLELRVRRSIEEDFLERIGKIGNFIV